MRKRYYAFTFLVVISLLLAACGGAATQEPADLLAEITQRGTLLVATDPAYPPQSELVETAQRPADTKCASDQKTAAELVGFDISTAVEIANRIGVEACFVTPAWDIITGGNWADRWDISVGSMTVTPERMEKLYFTQPYYTTPAALFVHSDNTSYTQAADLSGKKVGACIGCTYDAYLAGTLSIPGETINFVIDGAEFVGYDTDLPALDDLALGDGVRLDAVLTAQPTGQGFIDAGGPVKQLGEPVYFEYLSAAIDKASSKDPTSFLNKVTEVLQEMHADGTMLRLSNEFYGLDLTTAAGEFDMANLDQ